MMQVAVALCCVVCGLLLGQASTGPAPLQPLQPEQRPLSLVSELSSRLGAHPAAAARLQDARLPLPSSQDLEAIKKVAQILVTLGQQVIPGIIGEPVPAPGGCEPAAGGGGGGGGGEDVPSDPVNIDRQPA